MNGREIRSCIEHNVYYRSDLGCQQCGRQSELSNNRVDVTINWKNEAEIITNKGEGMKNKISETLNHVRNVIRIRERNIERNKEEIKESEESIVANKNVLNNYKKKLIEVEAHVKLHNRRNPKDKISLKEEK